MTTDRQLILAWSITGILAALLLVTGFLFIKAGGFSAVDRKNYGNVTDQRDLIRKHCEGTDAYSKSQCVQDLQDLSDMLRTFSGAQPEKTINVQGASVDAKSSTGVQSTYQIVPNQ